MKDPVHTSCPACKKPHVDEGEWAQKPHKTHRCVDDAAGTGCGAEWQMEWPGIGVLPVLSYSGTMFAELRGETFFHQSSDRRFVEICGTAPEEVVRVHLWEDWGGSYYGWIDAGAAEPCMIWPSQAQRDMCFPYGPEAEEARGRGRRVQLSCILATTDLGEVRARHKAEYPAGPNPVGHVVKTEPQKERDSSFRGKCRRRSGLGYVTAYSNSHGLCYQVEHNPGDLAWYDAEELTLSGDGSPCDAHARRAG